MKIMIYASCIFLSALAQSSATFLEPRWEGEWAPKVNAVKCELNRKFVIPDEGRTGKGFLSELPYRGARISYEHYFDGIEKNFRVDQLYFGLIPETSEIPDKYKISVVKIGDFIKAPDNRIGNNFVRFDESLSEKILKKLLQFDVIPVSVTFINGEIREFNLYPSGNRNFHVLVAMFEACKVATADA